MEEQGFDVNHVEKTGTAITLLQSAADGGHLPLVKYLVEAGASINMEEEKPVYPPLHLAASKYSEVRLEICRYLISKGADLNSHFRDGCTPLQTSTGFRNVPLTRLLLEAGANPNLSLTPDITPLMLAVKKKSLEMIKLLISYGADVKIKDSQDRSLLQKALTSININNYELVFFLVMSGAHALWKHDDYSIIPLKIALEMKNRDAARLLVNFCDQWSERQMFQFVHEDEQLIEMIEFLHECIPCPRTLKDLCCFRIRCSLASRFPRGVEQLCLSRVVKDYLQLKHLSPEVIGDTKISMEEDGVASISKLNALIEKDSEHEAMDFILKHNITERDSVRQVRTDLRCKCCITPLALASSEGYKDLVKLLLSRDFDPRELAFNKKCSANVWPIHFAAIAGQEYIVRYFIEEQDLHVDSKSPEFSYSLLHLAAKHGHLSLVKYLVEAGARINMDQNKLTVAPFYFSVANNSDVHFEICSYLISQGADVNAHPAGDFTSLQVSVTLRNLEKTRLLLIAGANPNLSDIPDFMPSMVAVRNKSLDILKLLMSYGANVNFKDSQERSLLQMALTSSNKINYEIIFYLVMSGAHALWKHDDYSIIPLKIALEMKNRDAARLLVNFCDQWSERQMFQFVHEDEQLIEMIEFLHECIPCPRTLKDLCCFRIRCSLAMQFPSGVEQLCLPRVVKDYLQLKHLSPELICDIK